MPFSSDNHAMGIVIIGDLLIKCDRGISEKTGLSCYKIQDKTKMSEVITKLLNKDLIGLYGLNDYFLNGIDKDLNLVENKEHGGKHGTIYGWIIQKLTWLRKINLSPTLLQEDVLPQILTQ